MSLSSGIINLLEILLTNSSNSIDEVRANVLLRNNTQLKKVPFNLSGSPLQKYKKRLLKRSKKQKLYYRRNKAKIKQYLKKYKRKLKRGIKGNELRMRNKIRALKGKPPIDKYGKINKKLASKFKPKKELFFVRSVV